ncbi:hypothetical protein HHK36_002637 [Tetracentron sinense]|uniref:Exonuclease domain-containing protein n=1 Tax=Tetracentron sinense TaxID=13715 RepID=A0A834ZQQ9_TETSI|nr:hypothetical protein HHK36_002637 [Tetracentron sinense]
MDEKIAAAEKEVLVEIVRLAQKQGMKGAKGGWKEFLNCYDRRFGASLSDPARRSVDVLTAFLKTFTEEEDLKFFAKVMQSHSNRKSVEQLSKNSGDLESPQQRLVRLTHEHMQYPLNYSFPSFNEEWMVTKVSKRSKAMKSNAMLAVDCEMVLCQDATEAAVRVCVVDHNLEVKLNELVNPNKAVADYRTEITGISAKDLEGITCSLSDIQKSMKKLLSHGTILVGHSLNNDLRVLKLDHARVIDTSFIFKYLDEPTFRRPSLNNLCKANLGNHHLIAERNANTRGRFIRALVFGKKQCTWIIILEGRKNFVGTVLGYEVRKKGVPHNCLDDACAAMKLVLAKIEHGFDDGIALDREDVPESEMANLLLHGISTDIPREELQNIFPGDFTIEVQPNKRGRGKKYTAIAMFKDPLEAHKAFESIEGNKEKDSSGRPQKLFSFILSTGLTARIYVREMARDAIDQSANSNKRSFQADADEIKGESKKPKTDKKSREEPKTDTNQCDNHITEIKGESKPKTGKKSREEPKKTETDANQCDNHIADIGRLKQMLSQRDDEILNMHKIISALTRKHGL